MESKKILAKYVRPSIGGIIAGWICVALALVMVIAGTVAYISNSDVEAQEFFPSESEVDSYVYIDVVGISPWLYKYDGAVYFSVEDKDGYLYTIRWSESKRDAMTEYQAYWERESDDVPMPEPYRLCGIAQTTTYDMRENLSDVWEISTLEYNQYFGTLYLNANSTPSSSSSSGYWVAALFFGLFGLLFLLGVRKPNKVWKESIKRLEDAGELDAAAEQLESSTCHVVGKDRGRLGSQYLFGKKTGVIIRYDEILWCYKQTLRRNFIKVNAFLIVNTAETSGITAIEFGRHDKNAEIEQALEIIAQRNPNAFIGYTQPNNVAYNELKNAAKK